MINETYFSLLNIGFNICFILYLIFKYFYEKQSRYYLFLALLSLSFAVNLILRLEVVNGDFTWVRVSRKAVVLFFYVFMLSFLDLRSSKLVRYSLIGGIFFIGIGIISRLLMSENSTFTTINTWYKSLYTAVDLFLIVVLLYHISMDRRGYNKYVFCGLLAVILCAVLIYFGDSWFGLNRYVSGFIIFQVEILVCFCFFFLAIITKESEQKRENERLESLVKTQKLEKEKSLHRERERIAFDMHDELGAGISAIKLQSEILKKQLPQDLNSEEIDNLIKISEHMNRSMREMLWSINPDNDNLKNFEEYCIRYGESYFDCTDITFQYHSNLENPEAKLHAEVRYNLLLILKEAFNNCVKHSQASEVSLTISADSQFINIVIQDNGIGLLSDNKDGYGLKSMRKRVEKLRGEIHFQSDENGTKITATVFTNF